MDYDDFIASFAYDKIADLSATTVALCLSAITQLQTRDDWTRDGNELTETEWDYIESIIGLGNAELMSSLVGVIFPHAMATASAFKFLPCDGGIYNKSDYPLLYDAIDPVYIISGTQFRTPNLNDRVVVGAGNQYSVDDSGGANDVTLTIDEIPSHAHSYNLPTFNVDVESVGVPDPTGVGQPAIPTNTSAVGGGNAHENRMPYLALNYVIVAG